MAGSDDTEVRKNETSVGVIDQGENLVTAVNVGDLIRSTKPVLVSMITGDESFDL